MGNPIKRIYSTALNFSIYTVFILIVYLIIYYTTTSLRLLNGTKLFLFQIIEGGLILLWILGITYNKVWSKKVINRFPIFFWVIVISIFLISVFFVKLFSDNNKIFSYVKDSKRRGFSGNLHQKDSILGFSPVKNSDGFITFKYRENIPLKYNENGFRIPHINYNKSKNDSSLILFLGCSFTFGNACYAEETFPFLISDSLKIRYINAGVCGYGLSQMYLLAKKLIPKYKPEFVVVQYSPWLAHRTITGFAPSYIFNIPNPYFTEKNDSIYLNPPRYLTDIYSLSNWEYDLKKSSLINYFYFSFNKAIPILIRNYYQYFIIKWKDEAIMLKDVDKAECFVYNEISNIANENNCKMIILNLGDIKYTSKSHQILKGDNILYAEADSMLWEKAGYNDTMFSKKYHHWVWNGEDSIVSDVHPNPTAHFIISNSIIQLLNK